MKLLCDKEAKQNVVDRLGIQYNDEQKVTLYGYQCVHHKNLMFYVEETKTPVENEFLILDLADEDVWELDKFQNSIALSKELISIEENRIERFHNEEEELCAYYRREDGSTLENCTSLECIEKYKKEDLQLSVSDLYLLVPGKISEEDSAWETIPEMESTFFDVFRKNIDKCVREEYNSAFVQNLQRKCVGEVVIYISEQKEKHVYQQKALVEIVKHETGFCIIEIIVQNCSIGGNKLLSYYCGNELHIIYDGMTYSLSSFCEKINVQCFGKKRSMVFVYNNASSIELVNALANEENPMGKIEGDFLKKVEAENIAQYDTAEVYVSHETMLEKCKQMNVMWDERLAYQAIELFFVELILFQDAAVDKVYQDLNQQGEKQREYRDIQAATEKYEQLSFDMAQAIRFGDYEQFNFPTVRESAKKVAQSFGIDYIYEKCQTNKELLGAMISANKRRMQERQDTIKNRFLLLLSALATIGTLGEILYVMYQDRIGGMKCYGLSLLIVVGMYGLYLVINKIAGWINKHISEKGKKKNEKKI